MRHDALGDTPTDVLETWPIEVVLDPTCEVMALMTAYHDEQSRFCIKALMLTVVNN